ncbi:dihydroorotate dehydrogenase electron transfer subunit [Candidatus Saganbacteria bacterium]|nr:dihydroorotate dehydrogenase electron transfer subunit [Candidatus Saganbacteria bacterium]
MIQEDAIILDHKQVAPLFFKLTLQSKYISSHAVPGQFVEVKVSEETNPLLRRPFSIHRIDPAKQIIDILYEIKGIGTKALKELKIGQVLNILGPLGNGFTINKEKKIAILGGGGMGVAPLLALADALRAVPAGRQVSYPALRTIVFIGARNAELVTCENDFKKLDAEVFITTDDGSSGRKGFVSDSLLDILAKELTASSLHQTAIYSCGPFPMLRSIAQIAHEKQIDCQVSMEAFMACGIGVCYGCAIETQNGYKMVCKDGPIFNTKDIKWN